MSNTKTGDNGSCCGSSEHSSVKPDELVHFESFAELKSLLSKALLQHQQHQLQQQPNENISNKMLSMRLLNDFVLVFLRDRSNSHNVEEVLSLMEFVEKNFHLSESNHLRLRYNVALNLLCSGNPNEAQHVLIPLLCQAVLEKKAGSSSNNNKEKAGTSNYCCTIIIDCLRCEASFLFLECIIHANSGQNITLSPPEQKIEKDDECQITVAVILEWINSHLKNIEKCLIDSNSGIASHVVQSPSPLPATVSASDITSFAAASKGLITEGSLSELKFRLHLYKSRILFLHRNTSDVQRQSKKEMKSAMEIFQHKIRRNNTSIQEQPQRGDGLTNYEDKLHQIALYLKANSEHLKGNAKKALKLCVEAENQNRDSTQPKATTAVHFNNLGILHQSIGKLHIALHYFNKALGVLCQIEHNRRSDFPYEEVNQNSFYLHSTLAVLYNVSLCAFQAKQWMTSYECMAKCVTSSPNLYALRPKCWLKMAEACIAHHRHQQLLSSNVGFCCNFGINEEENILIVQEPWNHLLFKDKIHEKSYPCKDLVSNLGSFEDIEETAAKPLYRALFCLQRSLQVFDEYPVSKPFYVQGSSIGSLSEKHDLLYYDYVQTILTNAAYVYLELSDPCTCLKMSMRLVQILEEQKAKMNLADPDERARSKLSRYFSLHRHVSVLHYACESLCLLGEPKIALKIIGENSGDDQLLPTSIPSDDELSSIRNFGHSRNDALADLLLSYASDRNAGNALALAASAISCNAAFHYTGDLQPNAAKDLVSKVVFTSSTAASAGIDQYFHDDGAAHASRRAYLYHLLKRKDFSGALSFLKNGWEAKNG